MSKESMFAFVGSYFWFEIGTDRNLSIVSNLELVNALSFLQDGMGNERVRSREYVDLLTKNVPAFVEGKLGSVFFPDYFYKVNVEAVDDAKYRKIFSLIYKITESYCFISFLNSSLDNKSREYWENLAFNQGFAKHFSYYNLLDIYDIAQTVEPFIFVPLIKISADKLNVAGLDFLEKERMLHMDMLRFSGRRSDAHCIRYIKASRYIKKNDRVLDVACGYGYGSFLAYHNSKAKFILGIDLSKNSTEYANLMYGAKNLSFRAGDAQNLESLSDDSFDFIFSFETIEHLPNPNKYLAELYRVLAPGGRLFISAPNNWVNEEGIDPNPDHLHIYDWAKLKKELVANGFTIEKAFNQTAGGALKCPDAVPSFSEVPTDISEPDVSEWVCLLAFKSPLLGKAKPYYDRWDSPSSTDYHLLAFEKNYLNPYLVSCMITRGERIDNSEELVKLQKAVYESESIGTADFGGALCGLLYSQLEGRETNLSFQTIHSKVVDFLELTTNNSHIKRWQISISFAFAFLCYSRGNNDLAIKFWLFTFTSDPCQFSPLLTTKVLDAALGLALLTMSKDVQEARSYLLKSIEYAEKAVKYNWVNVIGSNDSPISIGLSELSELLDKASRNASLVECLKYFSDRPLQVLDCTFGFYEKNFRELGLDVLEYRKSNSNILKDLNLSQEENKKLANEIHGLYSKNVELAKECQHLYNTYDPLVSKQREQISDASKKISSLNEEVSIKSSELLKEKQQNLTLTNEINQKLEALAQEQNHVLELQKKLDQKSRELDIALSKSKSYLLQLSQSKKELLKYKERINRANLFIKESVSQELMKIKAYSQTEAGRFAKFLSALRNHRAAGFDSKYSVISTAMAKTIFKSGAFAPEFGIYAQVESFWNEKLAKFDQISNQILVENKVDVILQVDNFIAGGLENVVLEQAEFFQSASKRVLILVLRQIGEAYFKAQKLGIPITQLSCNEIAYQELLEKLSPKVILAHCSFFGANVSFDLSIPFVQVVHNLYIWTRTYPEIKEEIVKSLPFTRAAVGVSSRVSDFFDNEYGMPKDKTITIVNGVDLVKFAFSDSKREELRKNLNFEKDDVVLLSCASISSQKNYLSMINAFACAYKLNRKLRLVIIGKVYDEEIFSEIKNIIEKEQLVDKVTYLGLVENPEDYYSAADSLILASYYEGCSLSVLEALANGLPVIASDIAVTEEMRKFGRLITVDAPVPLTELDMNSLSKRSVDFEQRLASAIVDFSTNNENNRTKRPISDLLGISKDYCYSNYINFINKL